MLHKEGSPRRCEMLIPSTSHLFSKHRFVPAVLLLSSALISSNLLAQKKVLEISYKILFPPSHLQSKQSFFGHLHIK